MNRHERYWPKSPSPMLSSPRKASVTQHLCLTPRLWLPCLGTTRPGKSLDVVLVRPQHIPNREPAPAQDGGARAPWNDSKERRGDRAFSVKVNVRTLRLTLISSRRMRGFTQRITPHTSNERKWRDSNTLSFVKGKLKSYPFLLKRLFGEPSFRNGKIHL